MKRLTPMVCSQEEFVNYLVDTGQFTRQQLKSDILKSAYGYRYVLDENDNPIKLTPYQILYDSFKKTGKFTHDEIIDMMSVRTRYSYDESIPSLIDKGDKLRSLRVEPNWSPMNDYELIEIFYTNKSYVTVAQIINRSPNATKKRLQQILGFYDFTKVIHLNEAIKTYHLKMLQERVEQLYYEEMFHFLKDCNLDG